MTGIDIPFLGRYKEPVSNWWDDSVEPEQKEIDPCRGPGQRPCLCHRDKGILSCQCCDRAGEVFKDFNDLAGESNKTC